MSITNVPVLMVLALAIAVLQLIAVTLALIGTVLSFHHAIIQDRQSVSLDRIDKQTNHQLKVLQDANLVAHDDMSELTHQLADVVSSGSK